MMQLFLCFILLPAFAGLFAGQLPVLPAPQQPGIVPVPFTQAGAATNVITSGEQIKGPADAAAEVAKIYLNFSGTSLTSVLNYLGEQKKINVIPHKDLDGVNISLSTRTALTLSQAWDVLLTLLDTNGFSLVEVSGIYRVVPLADSGAQPLPSYSSNTTEPEALPGTNITIRYTFFLQNMKTDIAKSILSKMIDEKGIIDNQTLNALIIKDSAINIKSALKIIKELDRGGLRESIEIIPLRNANADTVADLFNKSILGTGGDDGGSSRVIRFSGASSQKEAQYFSPNTKILSEPIRNKLILLGTQKNIDRVKDFIYKYIDVSIDGAQSRLHIKELKYAKADAVKTILDVIVKPPSGGSDKALVFDGGYKAFEDVIISAEVSTDSSDSSSRGSGNRLIIAANRDDWMRLEEFIDKLDKPQPQVAIEVMVVDVNIGQTRQLGAQIFNLKGKPLSKHLNIEFLNLATPGKLPIGQDSTPSGYIPMATQPTVFSFGETAAPAPGSPGSDEPGIASATNNVWGMVQATFNIQNSQIVSQPYLIANNNQKCSFKLAENRYVPGKQNTSTVQTVSEREKIDATTEVTLTPHINLDGIVSMEIILSISDFQAGGDADKPPRNKRDITTKASLGVGEVLVLGGLTNSKQIDTSYKTPILSEIPLFGSLFKNKSKRKTESNLYAFIRPSIIKPRLEGSPDEYTQLKLDYAKYQVMKNDIYVQDKDPVQRWFFKPSNQTVQNKLLDAANGILRPIDSYTYGRGRPRSVDIAEDPYFKVSEAIERAKERRKAALSGTLI